jgi:hypothetical protein
LFLFIYFNWPKPLESRGLRRFGDKRVWRRDESQSPKEAFVSVG